tara:strand:- start:1540 stop:1782 length:243 start_codon:yes stop_codon:yes gene_type:complete
VKTQVKREASKLGLSFGKMAFSGILGNSRLPKSGNSGNLMKNGKSRHFWENLYNSGNSGKFRKNREFPGFSAKTGKHRRF